MARRLHHLFDKNLERALQIVDKGDVKCYAAEKSGRTLFQVRRRAGCRHGRAPWQRTYNPVWPAEQVKGQTAADPYTVLPLSYCTCHAFFFDVVGHGGAEQVLVRALKCCCQRSSAVPGRLCTAGSTMPACSVAGGVQGPPSCFAAECSVIAGPETRRARSASTSWRPC